MKLIASACLLVAACNVSVAVKVAERQVIQLAKAGEGPLDSEQLALFKRWTLEDGLLARERLGSATIDAVGVLLARSTTDDKFQQQLLDDTGDLWARIGIDVDPEGFAYLSDSIELSHNRSPQFGAIPAIENSKAVVSKTIKRTERDRIGLPPVERSYEWVNKRLAVGGPVEKILRRPLSKQPPAYPSNPALRRELIRLVREDQSVRTGNIDPEKMDRVDAEVHRQFIELVRSNGFPDAKTVGRFGVAATWLIVQHQIHDPALMKRYLKHAKGFMDRGELARVSYALLVDRVRCYVDGEPQIYGTQSSFDGKTSRIAPVLDPAAVNALRAKMFMDPIDTSRIGGDCREMAASFRAD